MYMYSRCRYQNIHAIFSIFFLLIDRHTQTPVHYLNMKKTVSISCGKDHTAALTKVSQQQLTSSHKIVPPEQAEKQLNADYDLNEL